MRLDLTVNGDTHPVEVEARRTLADVLRHDLKCFGVHLGCEHGVCGACTVLLDGEAVRSCLMLAAQAEGRDVVTADGLGAPDDLHVVQKAFNRAHGLQCGFCTPGFVCTVAAMLPDISEMDDARLREELSGNICRCTGYVNIVAAARLAAELNAAEAVAEDLAEPDELAEPVEAGGGDER